MKRKLVIALLSTCLLAGCANTSQTVAEPTQSATVLTPVKVESLDEAISTCVTLANSNLMNGQVTSPEGTLGDASLLLALEEPCKTGIIKAVDSENEDFGVLGVKYSAEANMLCFENGSEVLTYKVSEQPSIYFNNDYTDKTISFRVESAEFTESWQYSREEGFKTLDKEVLDNEKVFEFGSLTNA